MKTFNWPTLKRISITLGLLILLAACGSEPAAVALDPTPTLEHKIVVPQVQVGEPATATPGLSFSAGACGAEVQTLDVDDAMGIDIVSDVRFAGEATLLVAGWGEDVYSEAQLPVKPRGDGVSSATNGFLAAQFDLVEAPAGTLLVNDTLALQPPCEDGACYAEVITTSPDGDWQIVHVWGQNEGAWLLGETERVWLAELVPSQSRWQWSEDGTLLWYEAVVPGYGLTTSLVVAHLTSPPAVTREPEGGTALLDPNAHLLAFAPGTKAVLSAQVRAGYWDDWPEVTLTTFDVSAGTPQQSTQRAAPGLVGLYWNETTRDVLLLSAEGGDLVVTTEDGVLRLTVPAEDFAAAFRPLVRDSGRPNDHLPFADVALSVTGERLALALSFGRVVVMRCAP